MIRALKRHGGKDHGEKDHGEKARVRYGSDVTCGCTYEVFHGVQESVKFSSR